MAHSEKNCSVKSKLPWAEYEAMEGTKTEWAGLSARLVLMSSLRSCYFFLPLPFFSFSSMPVKPSDMGGLTVQAATST